MEKKPYVIVVGFDFSELSERALRQAFELASERTDAEIHVLSVVFPPNMDPLYLLSGLARAIEPKQVMVDELQKLKDQVQAGLLEFVGPASGTASRFSIKIASHVRLDAPASGIAQFAAEIEASLIVIGTHGRHGVARWLLGSVAEGVVRHAHCPVLVIPPLHAVELPRIEPPCPACLQARSASGDKELWCSLHNERHGRRHAIIKRIARVPTRTGQWSFAD